MDSLPIKLNFFKRAEQYFELRKLDTQHEEMMLRLIKGLDSTHSTWNLERKILEWTYLHHKHLGTPIVTAMFELENYTKDWHTDHTEVSFCGSKQVLQNLVQRGFANFQDDQSVAIYINSDGLLAGSILHNAYNLVSRDYGQGYIYLNLEPRWYKKLGYVLLYSSAWILIVISMSYVSIQVLKSIGFTFFSDIQTSKELFVWRNIIFTFTFLPVILLVLGTLLTLIDMGVIKNKFSQIVKK